MVRRVPWMLALATACGAPSSSGPQPVDIATAPPAPTHPSPSEAEAESATPLAPEAPRPTVRPSTIAKPAAGLLEQRVPFQAWPALGARAVGLLVVNQSKWGPVVLWTRGLREPNKREGPGDPCYLFFAEGKSAQALYFPSKDGSDGMNFLRAWSVPLAGGARSTPTDVAMMCPSIPNPYRLEADAHLVRLEVNGGRGAPPNLHFIGTRVAILDGTAEYPIVAAKALAEARAQFDRLLEEQRPRLEEILTQPVREPAPGPRAVGAPPPFGQAVDRAAEGLFPAWDDTKKELSVLLVRHVSRTRTRRFRTIITPHCPPGAPCRPPHEDWQEQQTGTSAHLAYTAVFDRSGRRISEEAFASP